MIADYKTKNSSRIVVLDVYTKELSIIIMGIQLQLTRDIDYLKLFTEEKCSEEIIKCQLKIEKLESMLSNIQS